MPLANDFEHLKNFLFSFAFFQISFIFPWMKLLPLFILLFGFSAMAQTPPEQGQSVPSECVFRGTIHFPPEETEAEKTRKTEMIREVYEKACHFFTGTFKAKLNPNIKFNNVYILRSWEGVDPNAISPNSDFYILFTSRQERPLENDLYVNEPKMAEHFYLDDGIAERSVFFQGFIQFFFKSANLEHRVARNIQGNQYMDMSLFLWCQDRYIKGATQGKKSLWDYFKNVRKEDLVLVDDFVEKADSLFYMGWVPFFYNAFNHIDKDPEGEDKNPQVEYNNIVNNNYPFLKNQ